MADSRYFRNEWHGDVLVVRLGGADSLRNMLTGEWETQLESALTEPGPDQQPPRKLAIDFADLASCNSEMIAGLIRLQKQVTARGGRIRLCGLNKIIRDVFRVTRLENNVFAIDDGVADSVAAFQSE